MNNSLDKLIGNDELLTYICLILAILNILLMSMVINDTKGNFNIYIFLLFEALFLIFIVYFILKKKDVYSKDDDIKYDWYFYLRISIITLVFFNFALYIYNISNDSSTNPRKNGGGPVFSSRNRVAPTDIAFEIALLQKELKPLVSQLNIDINKLKKGVIDEGSTDTLRKKIDNINAKISNLRGENTTTSRTTSRASRTTSRASREASRASIAAARATSKDTNRVVPFPYHPLDLTTTVPKTNLEIAKIFRSELSAAEKIVKWKELNQNQ